MKQLFSEILTEIPKLDDKYYYCCIVVHPEDVEEVLQFVANNATEHYSETISIGWNRYFGEVKVNGCVSVRTAQTEGWHMMEHAGMQYTTILIDMGAFGKNVQYENEEYPTFEPVGVTKFEDSIPYMVSRLRTNSKYGHRMVVC